MGKGEWNYLLNGERGLGLLNHLAYCGRGLSPCTTAWTRDMKLMLTDVKGKRKLSMFCNQLHRIARLHGFSSAFRTLRYYW